MAVDACACSMFECIVAKEGVCQQRLKIKNQSTICMRMMKGWPRVLSGGTSVCNL
jgi:hypothetical protein